MKKEQHPNTDKVTCTAMQNSDRFLPRASGVRNLVPKAGFGQTRPFSLGDKEVLPHCRPLLTRGKVHCSCRLWVEEKTKQS